MKAKYRIHNWNDYNKSLIQRRSITVWFSEDAIKKWTAPKEIGKKGRPKLYSDDAILTALIIRSVFHLPLRALQGFLTSLVMILGIIPKLLQESISELREISLYWTIVTHLILINIERVTIVQYRGFGALRNRFLK